MNTLRAKGREMRQTGGNDDRNIGMKAADGLQHVTKPLQVGGGIGLDHAAPGFHPFFQFGPVLPGCRVHEEDILVLVMNEKRTVFVEQAHDDKFRLLIVRADYLELIFQGAIMKIVAKLHGFNHLSELRRNLARATRVGKR